MHGARGEQGARGPKGEEVTYLLSLRYNDNNQVLILIFSRLHATLTTFKGRLYRCSF